MKPNRKLIQDIVNESKPVHYTSPIKSVVKFFSFSIIYLSFIGFFFYNSRADIHVKASDIYFKVEILSIALLTILTLFLIFKNLSPYIQRTKASIATISILFLSVIYTTALTAKATGINISHIIHESHCVGTVTLITLPIVIAGFYFLKEQMTTHPKTLGFSIFAYGSTTGYLLVRFTCSNENLDHQVILHLAPVFIYGLLGIYFGNKHLRW